LLSSRIGRGEFNPSPKKKLRPFRFEKKKSELTKKFQKVCSRKNWREEVLLTIPKTPNSSLEKPLRHPQSHAKIFGCIDRPGQPGSHSEQSSAIRARRSEERENFLPLRKKKYGRDLLLRISVCGRAFTASKSLSGRFGWPICNHRELGNCQTAL